MSLIGYVLAGGVALLLLPVLPFLAAVWAASRLLGRGRSEGTMRGTERSRTA